MPDPAGSRGVRSGQSLRNRLTLWLSLASLATLVVFAIATTLSIFISEMDEAPAVPPIETGNETAGHEAGEAIGEVLIGMAIAAPFALGFSMAGAWFLTRRALLPLEEVIDAATRMSPSDVSWRLPVPSDAGAGGEITALVVALNRLLERIEAATRATAQFAADASHELRTPLAVITSEFEIALRRPRSIPEWEASAREALDEVRRLSALTDALLRLARLEDAGRLPATTLTARSLVEAATAACRPSAVARKVSIETVGGETSGLLIAGEFDALTAALTNLLANAIRHSPEEGRVQVSIQRVSETSLHFHVDDSGPGLGAGENESIFRRFRQGQGSEESPAEPGLQDRPMKEGMGLGLAIARRIARKHGGDLLAPLSPSPTGGARFTIELPIARQLQDVQNPFSSDP